MASKARKRRAARAHAAAAKAPPPTPWWDFLRSWEGVFLLVAAVLVVLIPLVWSKSVNSVFDLTKAVIFKGALSVLGVVWGCRVLARGLPGAAAARVFALPILAHAGAFVLATAFSVDPATSVLGVYGRHFGLQGLLACALLYFVIATSLRGRDQAWVLLWVLVALAAVIGALALLQIAGWDITGVFPKPIKRAAATMGHPNFAGNILALLLPLCVVLALATRDRRLRVLGWGAALLAVAGAVVTRTRGAWAAAAVALLALGALSPLLYAGIPAEDTSAEAERRRARFRLLMRWSSAGLVALLAVIIGLAGLVRAHSALDWALCLGALAALVALAYWIYRRDGSTPWRRTFRLAGAAVVGFAVAVVLAKVLAPRVALVSHLLSIFEFGETPRWALWGDTLHMVGEHPWVGSGPDTFARAFMPHKGLLLEIREPNTTFDNPHNNFLAVLATTGVLGLATYLWLVVWSLWAGIHALRDAALSHRDRLVALGLTAAFLSYVIWSLPGFDTIGTSVTWYALLAIAAVWLRGERTKPPGTLPRWRRVVGGLAILPVVIAGVASLWTAVMVFRADAACRDGLFARARGRFDAAVAAFEHARNINPFESFYGIELARTYLRRAQKLRTVARRKPLLEKAERALHESLGHAWSPENFYIALFRSRMLAQDLDGAIKAAHAALKWNPFKAALHADVGVLYRQKWANAKREQRRRGKAGKPPSGKNLELAKKHLQIALKVDRNNGRALVGLGLLRLSHNDVPGAKKYFRRVVALYGPGTKSGKHARMLLNRLAAAKGKRPR